jgi:RHS repeat-associated protein
MILDKDDLTAISSSTTLQNSLLGITREVNSSGTNYFARTPTGLLIDERTPAGNFNPLYDAQGDVIALASSSKKVERTFRYGPYGENIKSEGTQTIPYPFGYKSGYRMPAGNTGKGNVANSLIHFGERYYDTTTGRWTQKDPQNQVVSATQGGRFLFAGSDPINLSDPSGLCLILSCKTYHKVEKVLENPLPEANRELENEDRGYSSIQEGAAADADDWGFDDIEFDW